MPRFPGRFYLLEVLPCSIKLWVPEDFHLTVPTLLTSLHVVLVTNHCASVEIGGSDGIRTRVIPRCKRGAIPVRRPTQITFETIFCMTLVDARTSLTLVAQSTTKELVVLVLAGTVKSAFRPCPSTMCHCTLRLICPALLAVRSLDSFEFAGSPSCVMLVLLPAYHPWHF